MTLPDAFAKYWFTNSGDLAEDATGSYDGSEGGTVVYSDTDDDYPDIADLGGGYINLSTNATAFAALDEGCIALTFRSPANAGSDIIFAIANSSSGAYWRLNLLGTGDPTIIYDNGSGIQFRLTRLASAWDDDVWRRLIYSVDSDGNASLYLDGVDDLSNWNVVAGAVDDAAFIGAVASPDECYIGRFTAASNLPFIGDVAEVRLYDEGLTAGQIAELDDDLQPKAWVYLLAGQSNMQQPDDGTASATNNRVREHNGSTLTLAEDPIAFPSVRAGSVSMGIPFGKEVVTDSLPTGYRVILCPWAVAGTGFSANDWNDGDTVYENAITGTNAALAESDGYELKAILWHQGEADNDNTTDANAHRAALMAMIAAMRTDLTGATSQTPFVMGSLAAYTLENADSVIVNNGMIQIASADAWVGFTDLSDLDTIDATNVHFDADEVRDGGPMGPRYYTALQSLPAGGSRTRARQRVRGRRRHW